MKKIIAAEIVLTTVHAPELTAQDVLEIEQVLNDHTAMLIVNDKAVWLRFHFKKELERSEATE